MQCFRPPPVEAFHPVGPLDSQFSGDGDDEIVIPPLRRTLGIHTKGASLNW